MAASSSITPDIAGLRALSHPVRLQALGILRAEGPATATSLAARLGLNSGATSYHLRQLAQHGFIEEDVGRGNARERWWRAAHDATYTEFRGEDITDDVEAYLATVALIYGERLRTAVSELRFYPEEWQGVSTLSDWHFTLTPARAKALVEALTAVVDEVEDCDEDGAAGFIVNLNAHLRPGEIARGGGE